MRRLKAGGWGLASLIAGVLLVYLHMRVLRTEPQKPTATQATATVPASPSSPSEMPDRSEPQDDSRAVAQSMSGLLLLLGLACLAVAVICVGWIVWDVYQSRPAWKKQTKFPPRR